MTIIESLVQNLADRLHDTYSMRKISDTLEEMVEDKSFRLHAQSIITDPNLTASQKKTQLLYLIRSLDVKELYDFFTDSLTDDNLWLFDSKETDHLDSFVQQFQIATDKMKLVELTTAIPLNPSHLETIAKDLEKAFAAKVLIHHEVNPMIIGGANIHIDNMVYDLSLRTKFRHFEHQWLSSIKKTGELTGRYDPEE